MKAIIQALHEQALAVAKKYLKAEAELIDILQRMESKLGHRELGYTSLFTYATQALGLSEQVAYNLIAIARKSREVPELKEMIESQKISLTKSKVIASVLTNENKTEWLQAAQVMSKRELEREVVKVNPELAVQERVRPVAENRMELKVGISEKLLEELKRVQDLVSNQKQEPATLEETLQAMVSLYIEKKDPVKKAERARQPQLSPGIVKTDKRTPLPAGLKHQVNRRDQGQCSHRDSGGKRCNQRRWLDIHHINPVSHGGSDALENLTTLCKAHHQMEHMH